MRTTTPESRAGHAAARSSASDQRGKARHVAAVLIEAIEPVLLEPDARDVAGLRRFADRYRARAERAHRSGDRLRARRADAIARAALALADALDRIADHLAGRRTRPQLLLGLFLATVRYPLWEGPPERQPGTVPTHPGLTARTLLAAPGAPNSHRLGCRPVSIPHR